MTTITLRPDQSVFVDSLRQAARRSRSVLGVAPTGFGKTVVSAHILQSAIANGRRCIMTVHRNELLEQTSLTLQSMGIDHGRIAAGTPYDRSTLCHVASIDTLRRRLDAVAPPDLLIVDECHLARADGWHRVIEYYRERRCVIIGNSGSPRRLDGKSLGALFSEMVVGPSVADLIAAGHLCRFRYFAPSAPDTAGVKRNGGDYDRAALQAVLDTAKIRGDIVRHWQQHALGKRTVCFTCSHAHSDDIIAEFAAHKIDARSIGANTPHAERRALINAFADGSLPILCNVELITTGFDLAAQVGRDVTIEALILARTTQSEALVRQMWGRVLRRKPEPAIILDHAGNSALHGWPDDPVEWSLDDEDRKKTTRTVVPPVTCPKCLGQSRRPLSERCDHCGNPWPKQISNEITVDKSEELKEFDEQQREQQRTTARRQESACRTLEDFQRLGTERGYKPGWALHRWQARQQRARPHELDPQ